MPTLFDLCRRTGTPSAAIQGDHLLHEILATEAADVRWPPAGPLAASVPLDSHGYPTNAAVRPHLLAVAARPEIAFLFGHLNEADTLGHEHGPDDARTIACHRATDAIIGEVLDTLADGWERTAVFIVSDHDMEPRTATPPIDLLADAAVGELAGETLADGGAALVRLRSGADPIALVAAVGRLDGVLRAAAAGAELVIVEAEPGRIFASDHLPPGGFHGGPAAVRTVAVAGGGHPAVPRIAGAIEARPPDLADWAPTIATLLGLGLIGADGRDLGADGTSTP